MDRSINISGGSITQQLVIYGAVDWFCERFDIDRFYDIIISLNEESHPESEISKKEVGEDYHAVYAEFGGDKEGCKIDLQLDEIEEDYDFLLECLFHELTHMKQTYTGRLDETEEKPDVIIWEGVDYSKDMPYDEMPWEIEAHMAEKLILKMYKDATAI